MKEVTCSGNQKCIFEVKENFTDAHISEFKFFADYVSNLNVNCEIIQTMVWFTVRVTRLHVENKSKETEHQDNDIYMTTEAAESRKEKSKLCPNKNLGRCLNWLSLEDGCHHDWDTYYDGNCGNTTAIADVPMICKELNHTYKQFQV
jgi:RNAse (barnase) inhibitor barstar